MNKTILIAGGASLASLAIGGATGFLIAKKKFDAQLDLGIAVENEKTKKYFSVLLQQAKEGKPETITDVAMSDDEVEAEEGDYEEVEEEDEEPTEEQIRLASKAKRAQINYQGFSAKPALEDVVQTNNIFTSGANPKQRMPPRDETGKFVAQREETDEPKQRPGKEPTPYKITEEEFLINDLEHEQENALYFRKENTLLLMLDREPVDIERVGEVNLTLFPTVPEGQSSSIYVRNELFGIDYDVTMTDEDLSEYMGLGES